MGAEMSGVDLSEPLSDNAFGEIRDALHRHHVIAIRDQNIEPRTFLGFARKFGVPEPHALDQFHHPEFPDILVLSNVVENGKPKGLADGGAYWHTDYSYLAVPARATLLLSVQVPSKGGDTLFADQERAYNELPDSMKRRIDAMVTLNVYGNRDDPDPVSRSSTSVPSKEQKDRRGLHVIRRHPLVRRHPHTGNKALYAVSGTSFGIEGLPAEEGLSLLRELAQHATQPQYLHRIRYEVGDVVIWDNASVLHSEMPADAHDARTLLRITTIETERTMPQTGRARGAPAN